MKKRILFVDDQSNVLDGLRRMLRGLRSEWDMEFALGGAEALERLAKSRFDVVVSDMRMPGMDGAQLLDEVMRRYPEIVRIVLSGQSDQQTIMRVVGPAHQFLSKPCHPETLKSTVARACALRDKLTNESLKQLVSQVTTLPSLPTTYTKLIELLQAEDASIRQVSDVVSLDVGMTAKLLQLVNSSFFGFPQRVESPAHAVNLLGIALVKSLVFSAGIFSQFDAPSLGDYSISDLMDHSLAVSMTAQRIAAEQCTGNSEVIEDALLAGMVHDVGQLILAANRPDQYRETLSLAQKECIPLCEAELQQLGATHADVGAYLLGLWGLPDPIVEAVAFHHEPRNYPHDHFSALTAVHIANVIENQNASKGHITYSLDLDEQYLEQLGLTDQIPKWLDLARTTNEQGVS